MFLDAFYQNPLAFIGAIFACLGAFGAGLFFAGFFPGLPHLFTQSGHDEHQDHFRVRIVRGTFILVHAFILWEIVRLIGNWLMGQAVDPSIAGGLIVMYVIIMVILSIAFGLTEAVKNKDKGH